MHLERQTNCASVRFDIRLLAHILTCLELKRCKCTLTDELVCMCTYVCMYMNLKSRNRRSITFRKKFRNFILITIAIILFELV